MKKNTVTIWLTPEAVEEIKKKTGWVTVSVVLEEGKKITYINGEEVSVNL